MESDPQPQLVCTSCKTRKRKCDKALPRCSQCRKRNTPCHYSRPEQALTPASEESDRAWYGFPVGEEQAAVQSLDFPTVLLLDPSILHHGQIDISRGAIPIPTHLLQLLGDVDEIQLTASKFFDNIHTWMPFISKKRFYGQYLRPSFQSEPDVVLLLLALKLITTLPPPSPRNPRTSFYHTVKHYYLEVENSSVFSVPVLQAGILIALYELLHAIYPAAFLSIGACARYAHALGINVSRTVNTRRVLTLVEVEERRRIWWAIIILDRFVSIGCPGRPFAAAEPRLDDLLPADDAAWDQGMLRSDEYFSLSSPMTSHMSKFALLCQAARLLGQVLDHVSRDSGIDDGVSMQLDRTLRSMLAAALNVDSPDYDQITFIYSALLALHTPSLGSNLAHATETPASQLAKAAVQFITDRISANLIERECLLGRNPEKMSPWGLYFAYHICRLHIGTRRTSAVSAEIVKSLSDTFLTFDTRWSVAGVYLQLLEAQEAMCS